MEKVLETSPLGMFLKNLTLIFNTLVTRMKPRTLTLFTLFGLTFKNFMKCLKVVK